MQIQSILVQLPTLARCCQWMRVWRPLRLSLYAVTQDTPVCKNTDWAPEQSDWQRLIDLCSLLSGPLYNSTTVCWYDIWHMTYNGMMVQHTTYNIWHMTYNGMTVQCMALQQCNGITYNIQWYAGMTCNIQRYDRMMYGSTTAQWYHSIMVQQYVKVAHAE